MPIERLVLHEAPFVVDDSRPPIPPDIPQQLSGLVSAGKRGGAVRLFMTKGVALSPVFAFMLRFSPAWSQLKATAHTLPYDTAIIDPAHTGAGQPLPSERWRSVTVPTLVVDGTKSPPWMRTSMRALAEALPNARYRTLEKQWHFVKPAAIAPVLCDFFGVRSSSGSSA